ncbi:MAG: response regulator [Anaerolineae bacterium]
MKKRILVVDDETRVLSILAEALKRLGNGYEIDTSNRGEDALDKARQQAFDLVITDLKMPSMGGTELTQSIKEMCPDTAIIWITAYGCHNVANESVRLGVYCCLDKPLEIGTIRRAAREALEAPVRGKQKQHEGGYEIGT